LLATASCGTKQWGALAALEGGADGADCALVLRAVSHAAAQFPPAEADKLARWGGAG